jgi:hypothetical protein
MVLRLGHDINTARAVPEQSLIIMIYSEAAVMLCCQGCGSLEVVGTQGYNLALDACQQIASYSSAFTHHCYAGGSSGSRKFCKASRVMGRGQRQFKSVSQSLDSHRAHGVIVTIVAPHAYALCGSGVWSGVWSGV